jgi:hypothetical protein
MKSANAIVQNNSKWFRRNGMKKLVYMFVLGALCLPAQAVSGQDKPQEKSPEKPKTEERAKVSIPVKVQIVFTEHDGDKKIASMPYSFVPVAGDKYSAYDSTSIRSGVRVPIETDGKDQKTTYLDVGSNIDCRVAAEEDGRFTLHLVFDRSTIYPAGASSEERLDVTRPNGQPLIRSFRISEHIILKDGQTSESVVSTDPLTGHVLRISVTLNVLK